MVQVTNEGLRWVSLGTEWWTEQLVPGAEPMDGVNLPEPQRSLLVHREDMTGRLERHHAQRMALRVLSKKVTADTLIREVELRGVDDGRLAELGAIRINLAFFEGEPKRLILDCERPLGSILAGHNIAFTSSPKAFFRLKPNGDTRPAPGDGWLYGRSNRLEGADGRTIADVIEILPGEG